MSDADDIQRCRGYEVHLVDQSPRHIEEAHAGLFHGLVDAPIPSAAS